MSQSLRSGFSRAVTVVSSPPPPPPPWVFAWPRCEAAPTLLSPTTVVNTEGGVEAPLAALHPGDVVRIEETGRGVAQIVVLRRVWEQIASPEL